MKMRLQILFILFVCSTSVLGQSAFAEELEFNRDIRPILSDKCFFCHGPDDEDRQADLRLDKAESAHEFAIVPGKPDESEIISRIVTEDPELRMPPVDSEKHLSPKEIKILTDWIRQGGEYEPFWAYVPPKRREPKADEPSSTPARIDSLITEKLKSKGLQLSAPADPVTLVRRLYFDLIGLPPSPEDVDAFVADHSEEAYTKLIDKLLSSDHFGERMAIYWLDLVRYADTVGYHGDQDHNISPYRDWVIESFNDNVPFDQFTREQLAGDLLPDSNIDQKIATGYNRLLQTSHEGGVQPKEYLAIYAADRVRNLSSVWMGATVGCAQCHSHKYDPYTIKDFYSLAAFFADVDEDQHFHIGSNALPTRRPPELKVISQRGRERLQELEKQLADASKSQPKQRGVLEAEIKRLQESARLTMVTVAKEPREMRVLPRGNWLDESGPVVEPAVPEFLGNIDRNSDRATRLDLANWLTETEIGVGGLTARVQVNRYWYLLLGTGLSRSLDDFGGQGEPPTHPELLDELALDFIDSGWDVKHILKQILLSQTYRQSSVATPELLQEDPYNQFFARQGSYRLPAEMIRDNALMVAGLLNLAYGGESSRPYQPAGYYRHLNFPKREYEPDQDSQQYRRGVYTHWQRQFLHPMLKAFDAPSREECTAQRPRSNTPLAALVLLNDPTFIEAARSFATLILEESTGTDQQRLEYAFRKAVSRTPDELETKVLLKILNQNREAFKGKENQATAFLDVGLDWENEKGKKEFSQQDLAAWTAVARVILNLNETMTRN